MALAVFVIFEQKIGFLVNLRSKISYNLKTRFRGFVFEW